MTSKNFQISDWARTENFKIIWKSRTDLDRSVLGLAVYGYLLISISVRRWWIHYWISISCWWSSLSFASTVLLNCKQLGQLPFSISSLTSRRNSFQYFFKSFLKFFIEMHTYLEMKLLVDWILQFSSRAHLQVLLFSLEAELHRQFYPCIHFHLSYSGIHGRPRFS